MENFLQLRDEEMSLFVADKQDKVRDKVYSRLRTFELWGDIAELFLPKLADTFSVMLGGDVSDPDTEYLTIEEGGWVDDAPPAGPGDRNDHIR